MSAAGIDLGNVTTNTIADIEARLAAFLGFSNPRKNVEVGTGQHLHHLGDPVEVLVGGVRGPGQLGVGKELEEGTAVGHTAGQVARDSSAHNSSPSQVGSTASVGEGSDTGGDPAGRQRLPQGGVL